MPKTTRNPANARPTRRAAIAYAKPDLRKGPRLSDVTAGMTGSITEKQTCWVARAAYGQADFRWMIFRAWLLDDAPAWFRNLYIRHGEAAGRWLATREDARALVRSAMNVAIRRKLR